MSTLTAAFRNLTLFLEEINWSVVRASMRLTAVLVGLVLVPAEATARRDAA